MLLPPKASQSCLHGLAGIFQRHFLRSLVLTTLGTALILSLLIWLVQSLRYCGMMAYLGLSLKDVFYLSCQLLPRTLVMGFSWGFSIAVIWTYWRWNKENAFTIMRSCGVGPWFFNQPTVLFSLVLMGCLYGITLYGPMLIDMSIRHERTIGQRFDPAFITSGLFFSLQGRTLYVHDQPSRYHLKGVFLHDHQDPKKEFILCGQSAHITPHKLGFRMHFENGSMHVFPPKSPPYLAHFKSYTLNYTPPKHRSKTAPAQRLDAVQTADLWQERHTLKTDPTQVKSIQRELNYRFFWPLLVFLDALWIPPIMLFTPHWVGPLFVMLFLLHAGIVCPWPHMIIFSGLVLRIIFWRYSRKHF